jgi:hypothetical protein
MDGWMRGILVCNTSSQSSILHLPQAKRKGTQSLKLILHGTWNNENNENNE